jgi:RNA polymerase sigma-70 factor (ECF subfamily)
MVVSFARKQGLSQNDSEDVGQETVMAFVQSYRKGGYDRDKGRLRSWLFGIAYRKCADTLRRKMRENVITAKSDGADLLKSIADEDQAAAKWDAQWHEFVLKAALGEIGNEFRTKTFQAFQLNALEQWGVSAVAEHLNMSENAVYIAKNRVMSRLREVLPQMEEIW